MLNTGQQPSSEIAQAAHKSVREVKDMGTLRKLAVEALTPMMAKISEHVNDLLSETILLRQNNAKLIETVAHHKQLEGSIQIINERLTESSKSTLEMSEAKEAKIHENTLSIKELNYEVNLLREDCKHKAEEIGTLRRSLAESKKHLEENRTDVLSHIGELKGKLDHYYGDSARMDEIKREEEEMWGKIGSLKEAREVDRLELNRVSKVVTLYESERGEIRSLLEKSIEMSHRVAFKEDCEKMKKLTKIENEFLKASIQKMLNEALTPQIRIFLPILSSKLEEMRKIQDQVHALQATISIHHEELQGKLAEAELRAGGRMDTMGEQFEESHRHLQDRVKKEIALLAGQLQTTESSLKVVHERQRESSAQLKKDVESALKGSQCFIKQYIDESNKQFVGKYKTEIYEAVMSQKPTQEKEEQKQLKEIVFSTLPLLTDVKRSLEACKAEQVSSKTCLEEKLFQFSNQLVKMKSDTKMDLNEFRKTLELSSAMLADHQSCNRELSKLASRQLELSMALLSLLIDEHSSLKDGELYVTFQDGIVYESGNVKNKQKHTQIAYRNKILDREIFKRALLKEIIRVIDKTTTQIPLLRWNETDFKPSAFIAEAMQTYAKLMEDRGRHAHREETDQSKEQSLELLYLRSKPHRLSLNNNLVSSHKESLAGHLGNMTTSNIKGNRTDKAAFSRTITFETEERLRFPTTDRALDPKVTGENRNVDSKSIRLKKIGPKLQSLQK